MTDSAAQTRGPAYRITLDQLLIRPWQPKDAPLLRTAIEECGDYLLPWIPWMQLEPRTLDQTGQWLRQRRGEFDLDQDYRYGIFDLEQTTLIGETGLYSRAGPGAREVGYWIHQACAGRGYATRITAAMVKLGFEIHQLQRVEIHCAPQNQASAAIPRKLGFRHEATLKRRGKDTDGQPMDLMIWTLFDSDYKAGDMAALPLQAFDALGRRIL